MHLEHNIVQYCQKTGGNESYHVGYTFILIRLFKLSARILHYSKTCWLKHAFYLRS
jgi:hypothetical protein